MALHIIETYTHRLHCLASKGWTNEKEKSWCIRDFEGYGLLDYFDVFKTCSWRV